MKTRPRVGYIDLLETQIKKERNTAEKEGVMLGQSGSVGHWPHSSPGPNPGPPCPGVPFLWWPKRLLSRVAFPNVGGRAREEGITHRLEMLGVG